MPSGEFQRICRDLFQFGESIVISSTKEGIKFCTVGDIGTGRSIIMYQILRLEGVSNLLNFGS